MKHTFVLTTLLVALAVACSSSDDAPAAPPVATGPVGGAAVGPADTHCGTTAQSTSAYACGAGLTGKSLHLTHDPDAGLTGEGYGATMYGSQGADDACKYDVTWSSTSIRENVDVTFTIDVSARTTHTAVTGAAPTADVVLNETHPSPNLGEAVPTEPSPGHYTLGPVRFDQPGRWLLRFHFFEDCVDESGDSPHGHAAFWVDVP